MKNYVIRELAAELNVSKQTLRYYDTINLVTPFREANNYRYYTEQDKTDLKCILLLKFGGFHLDEIAQIMENRRNVAHPQRSLAASKDLLQEKQRELQDKIVRLQQLSALLNDLLLSLADMTGCSKIDELINELFDSIIKKEQQGGQ